MTNLLSIGIPAAGTLAALWWFYGHSFTWIDASSFAIFYVVSGVGVGVGLHRTFSHRAIVPTLPLKLGLAFSGSLAFQGSVLRWVADHRRHHRYTDVQGDTHSPFTTAERPIANRWLGLYHSHLGWMFDRTTTDYRIYAPDILKDRMLMGFTYLYWPMCTLSLLLPFWYGWVFGGWPAAIGSLLAGGCVRTTALHNVIWAVNSIGHTYGSQDASQRDSSRNHFWLAIVTFGEGWHNNHHAQPRSAFNDWRWKQLDLNGIIIRLFLALRLAKDPVYPSIEKNPAQDADAIHFADSTNSRVDAPTITAPGVHRTGGQPVV